MPSQVPRTNSTKKREQLRRRKAELRHAIRSQFSREKMTKAAEHVRDATLSLIKAELYWANDDMVRGLNVVERLCKLHDDARGWTSKPVDEILDEFASELSSSDNVL